MTVSQTPKPMKIPNNEACRAVIRDLEDEPNLTQWEADFIDSNLHRTEFTDAQKLVIARLMEKYETGP